jgi:hypothetical protein
MKPAQSRLLVASLVFLGWLGYLGWLVTTRPVIPREQLAAREQPLVLSVPQIQASQLDVIAQLPAPPEPSRPANPDGVEVTVEEVLFGTGVEAGQKIRVKNLDRCHPPRYGYKGSPPPDWSGPGSWLLALETPPQGKQFYEVVRIPHSPGFPPPGHEEPPPRIYPATAEARAQYGRIQKP